MEEIFEKLPFNSYEDLFNAIYNGKAKLQIMRSDCYQIAKLQSPYFPVLGLYLGFIVTTILLIAISIYFQYYWALILIPINFILSTFLPFLSKLKIISIIGVLIHLFIIRLPYFIFLSCLDFTIMSFFYSFWWNRTYKMAIKELTFNKEAFLWSWNRCGLGIEDAYGNTYSKLNYNQSSEYSEVE